MPTQTNARRPSRLGWTPFLILSFLAGVAASGLMAAVFYVQLPAHSWWGHLRLVEAGTQGTAVISRTEPGRSCLAWYVLAIHGTQYSNFGTRCGVRLGQKVSVTYLPDDPQWSCLGSPHDALVRDLESIGSLVLIVPAVLVWRRVRKRRKARG